MFLWSHCNTVTSQSRQVLLFSFLHYQTKALRKANDSTITRWWRQNSDPGASNIKDQLSPSHTVEQMTRKWGAGACPPIPSGSRHSPCWGWEFPGRHVGHLLTVIKMESCKEIKLYKAFLAFLPMTRPILTFTGSIDGQFLQDLSYSFHFSFCTGKSPPSESRHPLFGWQEEPTCWKAGPGTDATKWAWPIWNTFGHQGS